MFVLVSICHVGAHPGGHQHGVPIQIPTNLGKTLNVEIFFRYLLYEIFLFIIDTAEIPGFFLLLKKSYLHHVQ